MTRARMPRPHEVAAARRDPRLIRALHERHRDPSWRTRGLCNGVDPETFFPRPERTAGRGDRHVPPVRSPGSVPGVGAGCRRLPRRVGRHDRPGAAGDARRLALGDGASKLAHSAADDPSTQDSDNLGVQSVDLVPAAAR